MPRAAPPSRRFTLIDLMALVAAAGVGLTLLRPYLASFPRMAHPARTIEATYGAWSLVAACWMVALLALQRRRPCPRFGRLIRRPGHVACGVAVVALAVGGMQELLRHASPGSGPRVSPWFDGWITVSVRVGPAVAGAWVILALGGRWRADPGWIDRLGRLLGCCWIGWMVFWLLPDHIRAMVPPIWDGVFP